MTIRKKMFASELSAINAEARPRVLTVLYCDAKIHRIDTFEAGEPVTLSPAGGGGGTDFRPVFRALADLDEMPACLIYLTDGEGRFPVDVPEIPTLWAMTSDVQAPFGETVQVPAE